jgi:hypothetical protein
MMPLKSRALSSRVHMTLLTDCENAHASACTFSHLVSSLVELLELV